MWAEKVEKQRRELTEWRIEEIDLGARVALHLVGIGDAMAT